MKPRSLHNRMNGTVLGLTLVCAAFQVTAQNTYTISAPIADAFLSGALPNTNFGSAGTLAIAPASSPKGEFDTVMMFNTASAISQFNSTYGAGDWTITGFTLSLASQFGTNGAKPTSSLFNTVSGGNFGIDWLSNDSWVEGTGSGTGTPGYPGNSMVDFDSIPTLLSGMVDSLGTNTFTPPGNNVYANYSLPLDSGLVTNAAAGGDVSLYFYAADTNISYVFNSRDYTGTPNNHPELTLTVEPTPEPATVALLAISFGGALLWRRRITKQ